MSKKTKLSDQEMFDIAKRIGIKSFDFINEQLKIEFKEICRANKYNLHPDSYANVVITMLANLDMNMIMFTKRTYNKMSGNEMDGDKLVKVYIYNVLSSLHDIEEQAKKDKMN